jgi:hypothetical protein
MLLALNAPDDLKAMALHNYSAGVAMSMPQVVRDYITSFRQQERVKLLQLAADLRRRGALQNGGAMARTVGERIQKWQDEDEIAGASPN